MLTSFNKAVAETLHARAVDGGAGAVYRVGAKTQPPSSTQQHLKIKCGFFHLGTCLEPSTLTGSLA